jgi:hypothetical protein
MMPGFSAEIVKYLNELDAQIFAISFLAGVLGNLIASALTSLPIHWRIGKHHRRQMHAIRIQGKAPEDGKASEG